MFENFQPYKTPFSPGVILPKIEIEPRFYKQLEVAPNVSNYEFLRRLCWKGIKDKGIDKKENAKEYYERVKYELSTFEELGFTDYILLNWEILNFCHENNIPTNAGRGSAGSSLVLALIGVTKIDPFEYKLFFERFVSKSRAKKITGEDGKIYLDGSLVPDVDNDIDYSRRPEVIEFVNKKHAGKTCRILTLNTLSGKLCMKEALKIVEEQTEDVANEVSESIPKKFGKVVEFDEAIKESEKFKSFSKKFNRAYKIAQKLNGLVKNSGVHPSGVAICSDLLENTMPFGKTKDGDLVSGFDMNDVASVAIKFDILGLRTLTVIDSICKLTSIRVEDIPLDDAKTFGFFQNLIAPQGLFQIETDTGFRVCQKVKPKNIHHLAAVLAIARPGALAFADQYAKFSNHGESSSIHPFFDDILSWTGSIPLYQEQLISMARKVGFTADEGEQLRRCVTGDTRFLSKTRGWIKIETLLQDGYLNDLFLIMDKDGKQSWKPISNIWSNGTKQIRYVESQSGMSVKATMYHQFLTDGGWKARMRLDKEKDFLISTFDVPETGTKTLSDDWLIVLAGMVTEGYFAYGAATFTNYDKCIYDRFLNAARNVFGSDSVVERPCGRVISLKKKAQEILAEKMNRGKSRAKDIPEVIFRQDKESIAKFISFVLACEATITDGELSLTSASRPLIQKFQLLLTHFGIRTYILQKENPKYGTYWLLYFPRAYEGKYIEASLNNFGEYLQMYKKEKLTRYLVKCKNRIRSSGATAEDIPMKIVRQLLEQHPYVARQCDSASGRIYNGNEQGETLNANMFKRFCNASKDQEWINRANGKQVYQRIKSLDQDIREVEVFDFTVDEETPYIVANGLVIHNCVGKKKVEEMKTWKSKIHNKIQENNLDPKIAEVLWKVAEDSANYSFNASHAYCYSICSYYTTYLKTHYPKEFYLALLQMAQNEPDPFEEISKITPELALFGIKLLPPDLAKSQKDFSIEGKNLRFGLQAIKGISEKSIDSLIEFRGKEASNKYEIFTNAKDCGLSIAVLCSLIQAGCLDSISEDRPLTILEAQLFNKLTPNEKKALVECGESHNYNIFEGLREAAAGRIFNEKGKLAFSVKRLEKLRTEHQELKKIYDQNVKHHKLCNWYFERKLLGYSYSYNLREVFEESQKNFTPILEVQSLEDGEFVKIVGVVGETKRAKSKKNGMPYLSLEVSDETAKVTALFMDNQREAKFTKYAETKTLPKEDDVIVLTGKKNGDIIFVDKLEIMTERIALKMKDLK